MQSLRSISLTIPLWLALAACTASLPVLPPAQAPVPTGSADRSAAPLETAVIVPGTPTEVYALVARGALGCWFGAEGPLKPTHVFQAEADPPAKGGAAEIVLHERDESARDKRGVRAYRMSFTTEPAGVRMQVSVLKMEPQLAALMSKDAEVWAKGGTGCQLRRPAPPQPPTPVAGKGVPAAGAASKKR
ncbi:MAG: hypothetical protein K2X43_23295 [Hyphomonadaceae bacterium]|jgi:hypothetical protein|nr:hypothetical protein [Hyphomonadaceae bacterium]